MTHIHYACLCETIKILVSHYSLLRDALDVYKSSELESVTTEEKLTFRFEAARCMADRELMAAVILAFSSRISNTTMPDVPKKFTDLLF